jgi:Bacterial CdiA-CT RNAse A domain
LKRRNFLRAGWWVGIFGVAMLAACGPGSQNSQPQTEQARRKEPRRDEPRRDEARGDGSRRDEGENREAGEGEGRRRKSKSERRREREERDGGERSESDERNSSADASAGASSYGNSSAGLSGAPHDLSADEAQGGHTLSKHVGRSDAELQERLQAEPNISAASTWTDRAAAEAAVGSALAANRSKIEEWTGRGARRPNLAIDYRGDPAKPVGRCMRHGSSVAVAASDAVVVLKSARDGDGYYVLTTYPECPR